MKKFFVSILAGVLLLTPAVVLAGPFLTLQTPPAASESVTSFNVVFDAEAAVASPVTNGTLVYDLANLASGTHAVKVQACNVWGCSDYSAPYQFVKVIPGVPLTITIVIGVQ